MSTTIIAPSILAADWGSFSKEISDVTAAGADWIHIDVMDGHFVPPITFGPQVVAAAKQASKLPLDVHLMIEAPEQHVEAFAKAGADGITVHQEACPHLHRVIQQIHAAGCKAGVAINPATPVSSLEPVIEDLDLILIMSVNPGWGGQAYIPAATAKIKAAAELIRSANRCIHLEVDGGINDQTYQEVTAAGANVLVAGSYVFGNSNYADAINTLRS